MKILLAIYLVTSVAFAQEGMPLTEIQKALNDTLSSKWYEKLRLKGYAQFRYNRLGETNRYLTSAGTDRSIGDDQGFFMRRARLTFFGEVHDKVYVYIQPDYASDANNQNYFQIRDAYFDYALTNDKSLRARIGISKVPFGFDNLQSSSNRSALDRSDAINSAAPNERDTGVFLMYTPDEIRKRFYELITRDLKGTGDYGMVSLGGYNGQTLNRAEKNNDLHRVIRLTYPFKFSNGQFIETSLQAYEGKFQASDNVDYYDQRSAASFIVYPQPFGLQVEYNIGQGPEYDSRRNSIRVKRLKGGYAQLSYQLQLQQNRLQPYFRYQEYTGGKKLEAGAPLNQVKEWEAGTEWQPHKAFELTAAYAFSDRLTQSSATNLSYQSGHLFRLQAQFNY